MTRSDQNGVFLARFVAPEIPAWREERHLATVFWSYGVLASLGLILLQIAAIASDLPWRWH